MAQVGRVVKTSVENCATINLQVYVCSVCGEDHETESCNVVKTLKLVQDSKIVSRARQTLPKNLDVETLADGSTTVITNMRIERGTQFGPFQAPLALDLPPGVIFPLKVFGKTLDEGFFLDTTDEESCNWMCLVATATTTREQNLICYDVKQSIFFATTRDVQPGEELRLWYALYYGLKLQALPLGGESAPEVGFYDFVKNTEEDERFKSNDEACVVLGEDLVQTLAQHLPAHALGASGERDVWICKLCGRQETNVANYARHLMTHYHQPSEENRNPQCKLCSKRFLSRKMVEKHVLKIHGAESEKLSTCASFQDMKSTEMQHSKASSDTSVLETEQGFNNNRQGKNSVEEDLFKDSVYCCDEERENSDHCDPESLLSNIEHTDTDLDQDSLSANQCVRGEISNPGNRQEEEASEDIRDGNSDSSPRTLHGGHLKSTAAPHHISETESEINQLHPQFHVITSNGEQFVHPNNEESLSTSYDFSGCHSIDMTSDNGEPVTLIMVESSAENESINDNIIQNGGLTCDPSSGNTSSSMPNEGSKVTSNQIRIENSADKKNVPFDCDICEKSFDKCSYLYRHLRKHTGEFTCVTCLAVFARKENLKTHSCSQPKESFPCSICGKQFSAKKYLQRHTPMHTGEFTCSQCKRCFVSRLSLKFHRCSNGKGKSVTGASSVNCFICKRIFRSESKLKVHLKVHSNMNSETSKSISKRSSLIHEFQNKRRHIEKNEIDQCIDSGVTGAPGDKVYICEKCGAIFKSHSSLKMHRFCHGEKNFECEICKKRFHRRDVLQEHLKVHQEAHYPCQLCGKKYKTKKSLYVHSLIHDGLKRFSCGICGKQFFQKGNLGKHMQTHTSGRMYTCHHCDKSFSSKEYFNIHMLTHTQGKIHRCEECKRSFVKKHLLDAHRQLFHSDRGFLCKFCNTVMRHRHSVRRHLEKTHSEHRQEWSRSGFIDSLLAEIPQDLLHGAGDTKLAPHQQQERQQQLELLRRKHFQSNGPTNLAVETSQHFTFSSSSRQQIGQFSQGDPLIMLPQPHQLALIDNLLPDYDSAQFASPGGRSLLVSGNIQGPEHEILLTLVDQGALSNSDAANPTPVLTSAVLGNDMIGPDSGATYMMEGGNVANSVLLYVVETSNGEDGESEDLVWSNEVDSQQLE